MSRIENLDSLISKCRKLGSDGVGQQIVTTALKNSTKMIQAEAKLLAPVNDGILRNSIKTRVKQQSGKLSGEVYTKEEHATYVEFGTGIKGHDNHSGISPEVSPSYRNTPWLIPESELSTQAIEKYKFPKVHSRYGIFFLSHGQAAQPFLYPALKNNEQKVKRNMQKYISRKLKELGK